MLRALHEAAKGMPWKDMSKPAVEVLSGNCPKVLSDMVAQLLSGNRTKLLSDNQPNILSGNQPNVLSGNKPTILSGNEASILSENRISILSNIKIEIHINGNGNVLGDHGPRPPMPPMPPHAMPPSTMPYQGYGAHRRSRGPQGSFRRHSLHHTSAATSPTGRSRPRNQRRRRSRKAPCLTACRAFCWPHRYMLVGARGYAEDAAKAPPSFDPRLTADDDAYMNRQASALLAEVDKAVAPPRRALPRPRRGGWL